VKRVPSGDGTAAYAVVFEWSRVRLTLGAVYGTYSSVAERSIADNNF
jgi:hypothetical protein